MFWLQLWRRLQLDDAGASCGRPQPPEPDGLPAGRWPVLQHLPGTCVRPEPESFLTGNGSDVPLCCLFPRMCFRAQSWGSGTELSTPRRWRSPCWSIHFRHFHKVDGVSAPVCRLVRPQCEKYLIVFVSSPQMWRLYLLTPRPWRIVAVTCCQWLWTAQHRSA